MSPDGLSNVSTLTGTESVQHPFSDSEGDSDIENYRIKSILRGKTPLVYVKGETSLLQNVKTEMESGKAPDKIPQMNDISDKEKEEKLKDANIVKKGSNETDIKMVEKVKSDVVIKQEDERINDTIIVDNEKTANHETITEGVVDDGKGTTTEKKSKSFANTITNEINGIQADESIDQKEETLDVAQPMSPEKREEEASDNPSSEGKQHRNAILYPQSALFLSGVCELIIFRQ